MLIMLQFMTVKLHTLNESFIKSVASLTSSPFKEKLFPVLKINAYNIYLYCNAYINLDLFQ